MNGRTFAMLVLPFAGFAAESAAQESVSIREINGIPRDNIQELTRGGAALNDRDIRELLTSPYEGRRVSVFAVVMSDPKNSASGNIVDGRVSRVHFFVRDVAAGTEGLAGMGIHIIDDQWEEHGVLALDVGDVVGMTGTVSKSQFGLYLDPATIDRIGRHDSLGFGSGILDPIPNVTAGRLNHGFGDGTFQANWSAYPDLSGGLVCIDDAMVVRGGHAREERPDWAVSSGGASRAYVSDLSHRFRNDTGATYPATFNIRVTPFLSPRPGSTVSVCGFVILQAFNDPDGVGRPLASSAGSMLSLVPMEDADLRILEVPPAFESVSRPDAVLNTAEAYSVSTEIRPDPARSISRVRLHHRIDGATTSTGMIALPNSRWVGAVPPSAADGSFIQYWITALDSRGAEAVSPTVVYRTLDDGIDSVRDIQETVGEMVGPSPFANLTTGMRLRGAIQSDPQRSGIYVFQDDSLLGPWSGIVLDPASVAPFGLEQGDGLEIRRAMITERDGSTYLTVLDAVASASSIGRREPVAISTSELSIPGVAEAREGMIVRLEGVSILNRIDDKTWSVWTESVLDAVRLSMESPAVDRGDLDIWQTRPFIEGIWMQRGDDWILVPESVRDFGEVINVAVREERPAPPGSPMFTTAHPNPFSSHSTIAFFLAEDDDAKLEVFDVTGRLVEVLADDRMRRGLNQVTLEGDRLSAGPYLVRLSSESGFDSRVLVRIDR